MLTIYCDGGSRGNPGPAACAFVVYESDKEILRFSKYLGVTTNNKAEYSAVLFAVEWVAKEKISTDEVMVVLDSQLVTKQLSGEYKIKNEELKEFFSKIKMLENKMNTKFVYFWKPRNKNKTADFLVNQRLDKIKKGEI